MLIKHWACSGVIICALFSKLFCFGPKRGASSDVTRLSLTSSSMLTKQYSFDQCRTTMLLLIIKRESTASIKRHLIFLRSSSHPLLHKSEKR